MKKIKYLLPLIGIMLFYSCGDETTIEDEFEEVNGEVKEKLIKRIEGLNTYGEKAFVMFNYGGNNQLSSISDGEETYSFNYNSQGELNTIGSYREGMFTISELYNVPYDAFDTGEVLEFDTNGNPSKILTFENGYNSTSIIGEIFYDSKPNFLFYTLKSSMMLDVLDKTQLNFGYQNPKLMKARNLIPNNNIRGMVFKDAQGITVFEIQFDYEYDEDGYPMTADLFIFDHGQTSKIYLDYYY
ncbi:hypothetical protein EC396_04175 [Lutibacter sp. HS1-25]|uniref:hypothetical protein n=1 Tax=Lutibacter sp. HS1-25 TaxID=2485000 RepID=UPI001013AF85|nr:hypothetical protein [Lutibacter sp. HS1-25]RXP61398.1 hypothetical protein EC396_04175 [Lutibacter sp. HS1-25]